MLGAETSSSRPSHGYELAASADGQEDDGKCNDDGESDGGDLSNDVGFIYGIHKLSICLPQILVTLGMGLERLLSGQKWAHTVSDTSLVWVFRLAGIFSLVAMYIARGVQETK